MLTRKTPSALAHSITISKGVDADTKMDHVESFDVVYNIVTKKQMQDWYEELATHEKAKTDPEYPNRAVLLKLVRSWDSEYPLTDEGVQEAEETHPGLIIHVFNGYHAARETAARKN